MAFPEWTEIQAVDQDAVQYLRLNELRDSINEILFPYLTTVTPYFRIVSWLTWIYARLEHERASTQSMTLRDYVERALRYYGVFAAAHVLFHISTGEYPVGPIGVQTIEGGLDRLRGSRINFNLPTFGRPADPIRIYKSSLKSMKLLEERRQPITPRRVQSVLVPTRKGKELAEEFERGWSKVVKPDTLTTKLSWNKTDLIGLGKSVHLQGLSSGEQESRLLMKSARSSMREPVLYDDFVNLVTRVAKKCSRIDEPFDYADTSKAALYRALVKDDYPNLIGIDLKNSQATALMAYHELHTHTSYGADAVLDGLTSLAEQSMSTGISISEITRKVHGIFEKEMRISHEDRRKLEGVFSQIKKSFSKSDGNYQLGYPNIKGKFGFETTQNKIDSSENKYQQIALGLTVLLQSAACQELFDSSWLAEILPYYRDVFSAYTLLEEYEALQKSPIKEWTESMIEFIIQKHDDVARSKGPYARRFESRGDRLFFHAYAGLGKQRGRLSNAISWLIDVGILEGSWSSFGADG